MRILIKTGFGLLLLAFILIGLSYSVLRAQGTTRPVSSEGRNVASEKRSIDKNVMSIDVNGPIDLTLRQGAVASLEVRGEQRMLGNVDTTVENGTLHIAIKGRLVLHHREPLQVVLVLPSIENVKFMGSGDSTVNGFSGERINVQLHGSGNVKFNGRFREVSAAVHGSGEMELNGGSSEQVQVELVGSGEMTVVGAAKEFRLEQTGSGDLNAEHLTADKVSVELLGSGTALVLAKREINVTLRGSGDVSVHGNPNERVVNRTGSGSVEFIE